MPRRRAAILGLVLFALCTPAGAEDHDLRGTWTSGETPPAVVIAFGADGTYALRYDLPDGAGQERGRWRLEGATLTLASGEEAETLALRWLGADRIEARDAEGTVYRLARRKTTPPRPPPARGHWAPPQRTAGPLPLPKQLGPPLPLPRHPRGHILFTRSRVQHVQRMGVGSPVVTPQIWVMNGDGSGAKPFLALPDFTTFKEPRWLPPYDRLSFTSTFATGRSACYEDIFALWMDGSRLQRVTGGELRAPPRQGWAAVTGTIRDNLVGQVLATGGVGVLASPRDPSQIHIAVQGSDGRVYHPDPPKAATMTIIDPVTGQPVQVGGRDKRMREWQYRFRIPRVPAGRIWIRIWVDRWIGNLVFADVKAGQVNDVGAVALNQANFLAWRGSLSRDGRYAVGMGSQASYVPRGKSKHGGVDSICVFRMRDGSVMGMFEPTRARGDGARDPALSPDGRTIALAWGPFGAESLALLPVEALLARQQQPRVLVQGRRLLFQATLVGAGTPAWSPDGRRIVFTRHAMTTTTLSGDLWIVNADGSGLRQLTNLGPARLATQPCFSPDGRHVAFAIVAGRQGPLTIERLVLMQVRADVFVVGADGGTPAPLTRDGLSAEPAWGP